jgi:predicted ABC-type ATPase
VCASLNLDVEYVRKRIKQGNHDLDRDRRRGVYEKARISA